MEKRNYTNNQLKWLAENLTAEQMDYLLEDNSSFPVLDATNGNVSQLPVGEERKPVSQQYLYQNQETDKDKQRLNNDNQQNNNQNQNNQQNATNDKAQISTVCKAIKKGKLNKIEPIQLNKFLTNAGISTKNVASAVKYAIEYLNVQMKNPKQIVMSELENTVSGIKNCLGVLMHTKKVVAESMFTAMKNKGVDVDSLANDIRSNNSIKVMKAGLVSTTINESKDDVNISESVKKYYEINSQIKGLVSLAESYKLPINSKNLKKLTKGMDNKMNESVSAIKYSISYYKKNK